MVNIIFKRLNLTKVIINLSIVMNCGYTYSYYTYTLTWYVPAAELRAQWQRVVMMFQAPLWGAVLAFFLLNALAWWLLGAGEPSYLECVLGSLLTLLNGAVPLPRRGAMRFLVVSWTLCAPVLVAAYQSQLLSTLLIPVNDQQPITNQQELLESDISVDINTVRTVSNIVSNRKEILKHYRETEHHSGKKPALLQFLLTTKYLARNYMDARGKSTLYAFNEPARSVPTCLQLGTPRQSAGAVHQMMRRLVENGIVTKFVRDVDFRYYWTDGDREDELITLRHLDFAFIALLLDLALATLTFLLETVVWCTQHG